MKKFSIRAFVLTLALTGAVATTVSSAATKAHKATTASFTDPGSPMPLCKPNTGDNCGID
jgi:hypothetical protein